MAKYPIVQLAFPLIKGQRGIMALQTTAKSVHRNIQYIVGVGY